MSPSDSALAAYHELCAYTLAHRNPAFIHQHVVDAWAAQHADSDGKPIGITFALVGLYLHVERGLTGRQVQRVHMLLGKQKQPWPLFELPEDRGAITAVDALAAPAGEARDTAIDAWCRSVWSVFAANRACIEQLLQEHGIGDVRRT